MFHLRWLYRPPIYPDTMLLSCITKNPNKKETETKIIHALKHRLSTAWTNHYSTLSLPGTQNSLSSIKIPEEISHFEIRFLLSLCYHLWAELVHNQEVKALQCRPLLSTTYQAVTISHSGILNTCTACLSSVKWYSSSAHSAEVCTKQQTIPPAQHNAKKNSIQLKFSIFPIRE